MEKLLDLNKEEIETLLYDCRTEIAQSKARLIALVIEKDSLRRKIRNLEDEKEMLEVLQSGADFSEHLTPKPVTMNTLQRRYLKVIQSECRDLLRKEHF